MIINTDTVLTITFPMPLADGFLQSNLHCIYSSCTFLSVFAFLGNQTCDLGVTNTTLCCLSSIYRRCLAETSNFHISSFFS